MATSKITNNNVIEDISDKFTFNSAWTDYGKKAWQVGSMVFFYLCGYAGTVIGGAEYTLATIDSGYRSADNLNGISGHTTNNSFVPQGIVNCAVKTDGTIKITASNSNGNFIFVSGFYKMA